MIRFPAIADPRHDSEWVGMNTPVIRTLPPGCAQTLVRAMALRVAGCRFRRNATPAAPPT